MFKKIIFKFIVLYSLSFPIYAEIFFQDPESRDINKAYQEYNRDDFVNIKNPDKIKKMIMAGLLYIDGNERFNIEKNCAKGVSLFEKAWRANGVDAGYQLALLYYDGYCVKTNIDKTKKYLLASAREGYLLSQRLLGQAYWQCSSCDMKDLFRKDLDKSIYWFEKAAENGDSLSAGTLSLIYSGVDSDYKDDKKSFNWMYKSSQSTKFYDSEPITFYRLAPFYEKGIGTKKNLILAYKCYTLAGSAGAKGKHRVAKQMTLEQIQEGQRLAKEWMEKHNTYVPSY